MNAFGIMIFPDVEELDFVGPFEMITTWRQLAGGPDEVVIVAASKDPVRCANGLLVVPHVDFQECPQLDFLLIPGGRGTRTLVNDEAALSFVRTRGAQCREILSVCTGAFVLHAAGWLRGKKGTTHWESLDRLRALGNVEVVEDRWTRDGNVWTSAGVSAGMDLTLRLIAEISGEQAAGRVQYEVEYYPDGVVYGSMGEQPGVPHYIQQTYRNHRYGRPS
jgi:transcriptional regulator GlxA family with amidase domain